MLLKKEYLLYFALSILCLFLAFLSTSYDYDFFARIIVGERFIEAGILPFKDFLSYTPTHPWYDHEWGSGVVFYYVLKYLKPIGLLFLQAFLMFGTTFFIIQTQKLQKIKYPQSLLFITTFLLIFAKINPAIIRCQMFSFFFFSLFLFLMEKYSHKPTNLIWLILPITILWNNLHGGVVAGLGLIFIYLICAFFTKKPWKNLFAVLTTSAIALIINPYGIKYLDFLFSATTKNREYINEWWNFLHASHFLYYLPASAFIIALIGICIFNSIKKDNINYTKLIVIIVCALEGLLHVKLLSLGLIAVSALCYEDVIQIAKKGKSFFKQVEKKLYMTSFLLILLLPFLSPSIPRIDLNKFPYYETEFLRVNEIKGNAIVPFGYGSYISYKLYPNIMIYMDGRYEEVYYDKEFLALRDFSWGENGWEEFLAKYDTEIIMVEKFYEIYSLLKQNPNWILAYEGKLCGVFIKKELYKNNYKQPNLNKNFYQEDVFRNNGAFGKKYLH